jgi:hypothetical protein
VNKDYFPANTRVAYDGAIAGAAEVTVASEFSVSYHKHFKVVKNLKMSPPAVYILRICGSDAPTKYSDGTYIESDAKHFSVPVKGFALGWSTPVPFFEQLDLMDKVKLADPQYMHSPCMHDAIKAGTIKSEVGADAFSSAAPAQTDVELVLSSAPYVNWQGVTKRSGGCYCDKDVFFEAPADDTPLGRAEWIKFIATFFNEEDRANLIFSREKAAYDATKALATSAAALHELTKPKKKCAWVNDYSGYKVDMHPYKNTYCIDAGMEPFSISLPSGTTSKTYATTAELATALADVDVIIDETWAGDPATDFPDKASVLSNLGITLKEGAVLLRLDRELYDTGSSKNYAWAEGAVMRPAHVLQGLVHAVWPNSVKEIPDSCVDYFRDMTAGETVKVVDHTHCAKWDNANAESQCITNIISDDNMAALRESPAAKPSFIVAIVVALVVAFIGA